MDLQAIGIILVAQSKTCGTAPVDEDQFYKEIALCMLVAKVIALASKGLTLGLSCFARVSPEKAVQPMDIDTI